MSVRPERPQITSLYEGWIVREDGVVADASSSVTLIQSIRAAIIVDTGSTRDEIAVAESLSRVGLSPDKVTHVVNTHLHVDHCGCNHLFKSARFYAHPSEEPPVGTVFAKGEVPLQPGVRIVPTPGHTRGSVSVFVNAERRYAICGDAIPTRANYESHLPPAVHFDRDIALKSIDAILAWAEVVVPGHGAPFAAVRKK